MLPAAAAGFVSLLSLANMAGRFLWSSASDKIGRRATYFIFFALGAVLYASIPSVGAPESVPLFVLVCAVLLSMYGGGFATIPAYLRDMFGTMQVGAIHGRLLLAWSVAGALGPVLVNYIREYQIAHGVAKTDAYNVTMYVMAALARDRVHRERCDASGGREAPFPRSDEWLRRIAPRESASRWRGSTWGSRWHGASRRR